MTQAEMAAQAGVGQATVQRAERGESVQTTSLIRLLRVLGLLAALDAAIPESVDQPIAELKRGGQRRRRARRSGPAESRPKPWRWEEPPGQR
jgi:transcriptional regulator with XRE-family HTH domain